VQVVCFDVDSSFCIDESIDEIAAFLGRGEEVAALTRAAMSGGVSFQDALQQRLEVIKPTKKDIARFKREHPAKLSKGTEPYWYHAIVCQHGKVKLVPPSSCIMLCSSNRLALSCLVECFVCDF
jgi:2-hydroxy-3-keto-5-methylthiopentenyl-1-phosphate phosphatase